jgi:hypothetical protein
MIRWFLGAILWAWTLQVSAAQAGSGASSEVYEIGFEYRGAPALATVTLFGGSPESNPRLMDQMQALPLDHVAYFDLEQDIDRIPNQVSPDQDPEKNIIHRIQNETQIPVVEVRVPRTFVGRMVSAFKAVFGNKANMPVPSDRQYALVSMVTKSGSYVVMVLTSAKVSVVNAVLLTLAQGTVTYFDNLYNFGINKYLDSSWEPTRKKARETIVLARRLVYKFMVNHIYKLAESPARWVTGAVQTNIFMSTLMAGVGDVMLANEMFRAYQHDNAKLAKMNFFVTGVGSGIAAIDLVSPSYIPALFSVGAYEFKVSGALLMAYYATLYLWVKKSPESLFRVISGLEKATQTLVAPAAQAVRWMVQPVRRTFQSWSQSILPDCDAIFRGMTPGSSMERRE